MQSDKPTKNQIGLRYASARSNQSLCCPHEETLHLWLSKMHPVKVLIRLRKCWKHMSLGTFSDIEALINIICYIPCMCSVKPGLLRSQAPRSPIQVLTAISVAFLFVEKANHSTSVAIKAGFHSEAVEVIYILFRYISPPLLLTSSRSHTRLTRQIRGRSLCNTLRTLSSIPPLPPM